jgi:transposase-like protein
MWGGAALPRNLSVDRPIRRMRLRDQLELPQEITDGTVVYLSPHYRLLPASGMSVTGDQSSMHMELSMQLGSLGIKVVSAADATSSARQPALFLLVLCPGFFSCPELVEETAQALKDILKRPRAAGFGTCRRLLGGSEDVGGAGPGTEGSLSSEGSWQEDHSLRLEGLQRQHSFGNQLGSQLGSQFSRGFRSKPRALMPLMSTAMPYGEYARTCPPDLKDLGLFEANFDLWPESAALQLTAIKIAVLHLPGNHHAARHPSRASHDTASGPQLKLQQLAMSRRPQQTEQAERVDAGGEALQWRQHRHGQLRLPPRAEQLRLPPPAEPLRLPPRATEQRVWLGAGARSEQQAQCAAERAGTLSGGVISDSGPAGEGAPVGQALQRARSHRARSHARLTLQNVAKDVPGSSSSHEAEAVGSGPSPGPFPLRPILLRMPEEGVAVGLGGGAPQAVRSGSPLATLAVPDATPLPASPPPSDRAAKRASSIATNRQKQLNALMALEDGSSCHSSGENEHVARASSILHEDFGDPPEEAACSPTTKRLSVGQAMSNPSI